MMRLKDQRLEIAKIVAPLSLMIKIKEEDLILDPRTIRILISNRNTEMKTIRTPIDKLASSQIGTENQT